eukprot:TRINITY_DN74999_c0_g1_i1.p1 TRINITY_DN74999_c0_g1~~TRINITY_DN74999_c0_g1_i1.p1  ORF type:complete len:357 (+),score=15.08 TRINITY_DN74999_c0_g1_i1:81-1151(+)
MVVSACRSASTLLLLLIYVSGGHRITNKADIESSTEDEFLQFRKSFATLSSCRNPLKPDDISYTLVTQLTDDRLWMIEHLCSRWGAGHPVSLAVYTSKSIEEVREQSIKVGCSPSQVAAVARIDPSTYPVNIYPINALRNMALVNVKTSHALLVDGDFLMSDDLAEKLNSTGVKEAFAHDPTLAVIVPAFQMNRNRGGRSQIHKFPRTYAKLTQLLLSGRVSMFHPEYTPGHASTDYITWLRGGEELTDLKCVTSDAYEPYFAIRVCDALPPYQERFQSYGRNKVEWFLHLRHLGYAFKQIGAGFLLHVPHPKTLFKKDKKKVAENEKLWKRFKMWLRKTYSGQIRVPRCKKTPEA